MAWVVCPSAPGSARVTTSPAGARNVMPRMGSSYVVMTALATGDPGVPVVGKFGEVVSGGATTMGAQARTSEVASENDRNARRGPTTKNLPAAYCINIRHAA